MKTLLLSSFALLLIASPLIAEDDSNLRSHNSRFPIEINWHNKTTKPVRVVWINYDGKPVEKNEVLAPDGQLRGKTALGHLFRIQGERLDLMFLVSSWHADNRRPRPNDKVSFIIDDEDLSDHFEYEYQRDNERGLFRCLSYRYVLPGTAWKQTHYEADGTETVTLYSEVDRGPDHVMLHDPVANQTVVISSEGMLRMNNDREMSTVKVADGEWNIPK